MKKALIFFISIILLCPTTFAFGNINAAAYRQHNYKNKNYAGRRSTQQKNIPYWQIQSNYASRVRYQQQRNNINNYYNQNRNTNYNRIR